jgi:beta-lactamase superfamily II metal-dependent hydrolase
VYPRYYIRRDVGDVFGSANVVCVGVEMPGAMRIRVWDVEHGACVMIQHVMPTPVGGVSAGRLAMIDAGDSGTWSPSSYIRYDLGRTTLDYLFITNADQDHMSDLRGLDQAGVTVDTLIRNPSYTSATMRSIKLGGGPLTGDAEWYLRACDSFNVTTIRPFNQYMGGITCDTFHNSYPWFIDTNNLSLVVFIRFGGVTFLFPGDLEREGWLALFARPDFKALLGNVSVLMASHHGRENGFCDEVFKYCRPHAVVISDKEVVHDTQRTLPDYRAVVRDTGVVVRTTGKRRHVLTTRRDGWIQFEVDDSGNCFIDTENRG